MEATRPRQLESTETWNNLPLGRGVLAGGFRLEANPAQDQPPRMADGHPIALTYVLAGLLADWDADVPDYRKTEMPDHTRRALEALGYLQDD